MRALGKIKGEVEGYQELPLVFVLSHGSVRGFEEDLSGSHSLSLVSFGKGTAYPPVTPCHPPTPNTHTLFIHNSLETRMGSAATGSSLVQSKTYIFPFQYLKILFSIKVAQADLDLGM